MKKIQQNTVNYKGYTIQYKGNTTNTIKYKGTTIKYKGNTTKYNKH